jgi:Ca2+-transporting ATPase
MERPPRPPGERLFDSASLLLAIALGASVLAGALAVYAWALSSQRPAGEAQALAFAAIIAGNLALIVANRSGERTLWQALAASNRAFAWIVAGALAALLAAVYAPSAAEVFRFHPPRASDMAWAMAAGAAPVLWYDIAKLARRRAHR